MLLSSPRPRSRTRFRRSRSRPARPLLSVSRWHAFFWLITFGLKHWLVERWRNTETPVRRPSSQPRERIFVDASFTCHSPQGIGPGVGGIGVWVPRLRMAFALKVDVKSSMEAETLALLAGALLAKKMSFERPIIFSDCKSAVHIASRHFAVGRGRGIFGKIARCLQLSTEHRAFRHIFDTVCSLRGSLEWKPRELNREADLASNIGSRHGSMGIILTQAKNHNHALNDVLSRDAQAVDEKTGVVRRHYRGGTRTVGYAARKTTTSRAFLRDTRRLIAQFHSEVA